MTEESLLGFGIMQQRRLDLGEWIMLPKEAIQWFDKALAIEPKNVTALENKEITLKLLGE